jgi:hypothetical protein
MCVCTYVHTCTYKLDIMQNIKMVKSEHSTQLVIQALRQEEQEFPDSKTKQSKTNW